jgi:hypothetical protein
VGIKGVDDTFPERVFPQPRRSVALRGLLWIPACAGMTGMGRAEGRSPSAFFYHSSPLFMLSDCPVIIAARSEARKAMASATSFESGNLPSG